MTRRFGRRAFIGTLGAGLTVPLLDSLRPRQAFGGDGGPPRRLVIVYHPNGTNPETWFPTPGGSETDFAMTPVFEPLVAFRQRLLITRGIDLASLAAGPGEPHQRGMGGLLTGRPLQQGTFVGGDGSLAGWGDGISIDQHVANHLGGDSARKSLELGVRVLGSEVRHRLSYAGPGQPLPPESNPQALFEELFAGLGDSPSARVGAQRRRRSVLDAAAAQFEHVRGRVGEADRYKLDLHRAMVRQLERQLDRMTSVGGACQVPAEPTEHADPEAESAMQDVSRAMIDLATMALACDMTRVITLQYSSSANNIRFPFLDSYADDHALSHAGPSDDEAREEWSLRQRWYAEELAYLLGRLEAVPEGDGSVLDHTLVVWCSELGQGNNHSQDDVPFVLAGGLGLRGGRYVQYQHASHNDLLVAVMNAMGVAGETFGDPEFCHGPLAGLF